MIEDLSVELQTISVILRAAGALCIIVAFIFWVKLGYLGRIIRKVQRVFETRKQKKVQRRKEKETAVNAKRTRTRRASDSKKTRMTPIREEIIGLENSEDDTGLLSMVTPLAEDGETEDIEDTEDENDADDITETAEDITEALDKKEESRPHFIIKKKAIISEADHKEV